MKYWISIPRSSFPGSGGLLIKGHETIPYNIIAECLRNYTSNKYAKKTYTWALSKLKILLDHGHPDKWVRIYIHERNGKYKYEIDHVFELLTRKERKKILPFGYVDHWKHFKRFRNDVINLICRAGLTVKCLNAMTSYYPEDMKRLKICDIAACTIQRVWKLFNSHKKAIVIQSSWRGYWHRKYVYYNPETEIGKKRLQRLAELHTDIID